jgi:phage recombination protein Bet
LRLSNEIAKSAEDYTQQRAIVDTVRNTVFPSATDPELMLYFHKCVVCGVHPLSGMVHPMKFNSNEGAKVTFIVSIDLLRSRSSDTGKYDGMDEAEYEGIIQQQIPTGGEIDVPELARVRVYRSDVTRPFVGVARWKEFYPGEKKGHQWRQKPYLMLAKCAEAQARRLAFPQDLDKLYTAEEMQATTEMLAGLPDPKSSSKPSVSPDQVKERVVGSGEQGERKAWKKPSEQEVKNGKLISDKQAGLLFGKCKQAGVEVEAVCNYLKIESPYYITWDNKSKTNFNVVLKTIEEKPNFFAKYSVAAQVVESAPASEPVQLEDSVMGAEDFEKLCFSLCLSAGISDEQFVDELESVFKIKGGLKAVPGDAKIQSNIIDYLNSKAEEAGA